METHVKQAGFKEEQSMAQAVSKGTMMEAVR
jgi:hypothetical protein